MAETRGWPLRDRQAECSGTRAVARSRRRLPWPGPALALVMLTSCAGPASPSPRTLAQAEAQPELPTEPPPPPPEPADRDGDLILDRCDECPDEPEPYNLFEDDDGCPERLTIEESRHPVPGVTFYLDQSSDLGDRAPQQLALVVQQLKFAHAETVLCLGDAAPGEPDPDALSLRRAQDTCARLIAAGAALRCQPYGRGVRAMEDRPIEQRRRVDILQLDARLVEHWYRPLYVFARYDGEELQWLWRLVGARPTGRPTCPSEL